MKTLFLNPPSFSRFDSAGARFAATRKTHSLWYPAWLGYGAAYVNESRLIDCPAAGIDLKKLLELIKGYMLIVIYTSTQSFNNDLAVARAIKEKQPQTKIIFTGPHASVLTKETLKASDSIDGVARKEFEETVLEISQKKPWSEIKGLSYKKGQRVVHNPDRPLLMNLDKIPFVSKIYQRDVPLKSYHLPFTLHPYIAIYAGRGCPNFCTFCLWPQTFTGRVYRKRSVDNVIKEIFWIKKNLPEIKEIFFDDDTFTTNRPWVEEFCRKVKPLKVVWSVNARADLSYKLLRLMKESGCRFMVVGFESGDDQILKKMKKGVTLTQMRTFTKEAKRAGLMIHGTFLLGLPGETLETINKTLSFACELDPETIQVTIATPLPGTEFYEYCRKNHFLTSASLIDRTGYQAPVIAYPRLSAEAIHQAVEKFHLKFYFRPQYILKTLGTAFSSPTEAKRILISAWEYSKYLLSSYP